MIHLEDIQSLSDFQRNARATVDRVNKTGRASVLTVNGRARCVVIGAKQYEEMAALLDRQQSLAEIRKSLEEAEAGEGENAESVHAGLRGRVKKAIPGRKM